MESRNTEVWWVKGQGQGHGGKNGSDPHTSQGPGQHCLEAVQAAETEDSSGSVPVGQWPRGPEPALVSQTKSTELFKVPVLRLTSRMVGALSLLPQAHPGAFLTMQGRATSSQPSGSHPTYNILPPRPCRVDPTRLERGWPPFLPILLHLLTPSNVGAHSSPTTPWGHC